MLIRPVVDLIGRVDVANGKQHAALLWMCLHVTCDSFMLERGVAYFKASGKAQMIPIGVPKP